MIASKNALAKTINALLDANSVNGIADLVIEENTNKNTSIRGADASNDVSCDKNMNVNEVEKDGDPIGGEVPSEHCQSSQPSGQ